MHRVWSGRIAYVQAGAVSRHYYHYFASAFVQETAVEFWARFKVAGPGVVLVHSANLALTWWLLAEFCAELNICDNRQHHWPVLPPALSVSLSLLCLHVLFICPPFFPAFQDCPVWGVRTDTEKAGKWEPLMPLDQFLLPVPISITATSAGPKVARSSEHLAPPPCFLRSVGSICLWTSPPSVSLTTSNTLRKPDKMLWSIVSIDKLKSVAS